MGRRRAVSGPNEVPERTTPAVVRLARQFWGPTAWMLEVTVALSAALGNYVDAAIIAFLLVFNAVLGFTQDWRAGKALELLREHLQVGTRVLRDGTWTTRPARELVPGDVVRIRAGDVAPADLKLGSGEVEMDESALTGESAPVQKGTDGLVFSGSITRRGEATGVVVLTGASTLFGRTTVLVRSAHPRSHVIEVTNQLVRWLLLLVAAFLAVGLAAAALEGLALVPLLPLALLLLISAIPVALPAMFTVATALGALELARRGVLVTRLNASEDAASMDLLLTDKTGTLTENRAEVSEVLPTGSLSPEDVLRLGAACSQEADQDPLDLAFLQAARDRGPSRLPPLKRFLPFDPSTRRTEALFGEGDAEIRVTKGSPGALEDLAGLGGEEREGLEAQVRALAERGARPLAVARKLGPRPWEIVGLVGIRDPPRKDAGALVSELRELGVGVRMITGDSQAVAAEVAQSVGIGSRIVDGGSFRASVAKDWAEAGIMAEGADGFSRVYPEDKFGIVRALQHRGHLVGMTGDGVNDAPALAQAEVGIAVSTATDVAKASASAVLTRPGLEPMVQMVRIGRQIHQRVVTWVLSKIVKTFQIAVFVVLAFLLFGTFVVTPFDVVLLLLSVDFVMLSLATDRASGSSAPTSWRMAPLLLTGMMVGVLALGESLLLLVLLRHLVPKLTSNASELDTLGFELLFYFGIFTVLSVRSPGHFWRAPPGRDFLLVVLLDLAALTGLVSVGIPYLSAVPLAVTLPLLLGIALFSLGVNDAVKTLLLRHSLSPPRPSRVGATSAGTPNAGR